jgi:hypothetical protein
LIFIAKVHPLHADTNIMRIPPISLHSAMIRSMPAIDPSARVEKRMAPEGVGRQRSATIAKGGSAAVQSRSRKRRASYDGLGQEVDVLA